MINENNEIVLFPKGKKELGFFIIGFCLGFIIDNLEMIL